MVRCELSEELGLLVAATGAENHVQLVASSPDRRCECVHWSVAGGVLVRMALDEIEAGTAVVEEDSGSASRPARPDTEVVGLDV